MFMSLDIRFDQIERLIKTMQSDITQIRSKLEEIQAFQDKGREETRPQQSCIPNVEKATSGQQSPALVSFDEILKNACEKDSLAGALAHIAIWETERAVQQSLKAVETGQNPEGGTYETTFLFLFHSVMDLWHSKENAERVKHGEMPWREGPAPGLSSWLSRLTNIQSEIAVILAHALPDDPSVSYIRQAQLALIDVIFNVQKAQIIKRNTSDVNT